MAVQQNKKSPSRRGMHRAHDHLSPPAVAIEPTTGETQRGVGRCFAAQGALVRLWRGDRERQAEPREELFPVARGRSQNEPPGRSPHFGYGFVLTREFQG